MLQPMSGHFLWSDFTETHIPNLFTIGSSSSIPTNKTLLILIVRYIDPVTEVEIGSPDAKIGHWIGGHDNYWVKVFGNPPSRIEYASWNNPSNNNTTIVNVYELNGYNMEILKTEVIKNLNGGFRVNGGRPENGTVTNAQWNQALAWAANY